MTAPTNNKQSASSSASSFAHSTADDTEELGVLVAIEQKLTLSSLAVESGRN